MLFWMDASRNRMVCYHLIYKRCVLPCCVCYTTGSDVTTWWQCCGSGRIRNEFDKNYSEKLINLTISQQNAQFKIVIYVKNIRTNSCRIRIRSWIWIRNHLKSLNLKRIWNKNFRIHNTAWWDSPDRKRENLCTCFMLQARSQIHRSKSRGSPCRELPVLIQQTGRWGKHCCRVFDVYSHLLEQFFCWT
jgi:hypothetical protein